MDTPTLETTRDTSYDWLRLFATVCVVIGHSCYLQMVSPLGGVAYAFPENVSSAAFSLPYRLFDYLSHLVYAFHMPLFFLLSGAVLALRPLPSMKQLTLSKAKRLLLPYLVYGYLFMFPLKWLSGYYRADTILPALGAFLLGEESGHLWFLPSLFWAMVVFAGIRKLTEKLPHGLLWTLLACGLLQLGASRLPRDLFLLGKGLSYVFYFALGYGFQMAFPSRRSLSSGKALLLLVLFLGFFAAARLLDLGGSLINALLGSLSLYFLSYLCSRWFSAFERTKVWALLIGGLFSVYLLHDPMEYLILKLSMRSGLLTTGPGFFLYVLLRSAGIFLLSLALGEGIRKLKLHFTK